MSEEAEISSALPVPGRRLTPNTNVLSFDVGIQNLCYCLLEHRDEPDREYSIRLWENMSLRADGMVDAIASLRRELDARPWMQHVDHVVIEAQVAANPAMKVISHAIQMYFACRAASAAVHFVSPKNKFKVCNVPEPEGVKGHARNKRIAVLMAQKLLGAQRERASLEYLNSHVKKDDLADSFLQAVYFLRLLKQRSRNRLAIWNHIADAAPATRTVVVDESDDDPPAQRVYHSEEFALAAEFTVDRASVEPSVRFPRGSAQKSTTSEK
jgi:hypothetical protein